jgi:hypothetical protein
MSSISLLICAMFDMNAFEIYIGCEIHFTVLD